MSDLASLVYAASVAGVVGGLWLLGRGFAGWRRAGRVADTATSRIATLAVGEVRVTGRVEPAELLLVSPLQGRACVYYRARVTEREGRTRRTVLRDERAVGFRVRDESGAIRVFPRGGSWDVPPGFSEHDGITGDVPVGLSPRLGPAIQPASPERAELVARLLTVRPADDPAAEPALDSGGGGSRDYEEARVEPGEVITIVGTALPFDQLPDPDAADLAEDAAIGGPLAAAGDPEIAADLEAARAAGSLETDPGRAWGNAAIEGFGIGRPVRAPELDPAATPPPVADAPTAERFRRTFEIAPTELVLAAAPDCPLLASLGAPAAVVTRGRDRFLLGLLGAALAIASAVLLALGLAGGLPT